MLFIKMSVLFLSYISNPKRRDETIGFYNDVCDFCLTLFFESIKTRYNIWMIVSDSKFMVVISVVVYWETILRIILFVFEKLLKTL